MPLPCAVCVRLLESAFCARVGARGAATEGFSMAEINKLSAKGVAAKSEPGRHSDGGNLYLSISKAGAKSWVFFYRKDGKQREMGLGGYPAVGLADARETAAEARRLLAQGQDPLAAKKAAKAEAKAADDLRVTFGEFARDYIETHEADWKNAKHIAQWRSTLLGPQAEAKDGSKRKPGPDYCADLRKMPISEIDTDDVLATIRPYWNTKRETASRIRQRIEVVLDAAVVAKKRAPGLNPARWKGHIALMLPKHGKRSKGHFAAMPWEDVPEFMAALAEREGIAARAVEFLILTCVRSNEVRFAQWGDFDFDRKLWTIPAERMKADRDHRVPLSDAAIAAVQTMLPLRPRRPEDQASALVFPGLRRSALSDMTLSAVLKRMKIEGATIHGFRSSFRDWGSEATTTPDAILEMCLAHKVGDATVQAYVRSDLFEKRRIVIAQWADFLTAPPDDEKVVLLRAGEAS